MPTERTEHTEEQASDLELLTTKHAKDTKTKKPGKTLFRSMPFASVYSVCSVG